MHGTPPLLASRGWEATTRDTLTESILDLGPDVLSVQDGTGFSGPPLETVYAGRHTVIGQFAYRWGLPHSSAHTRILEADTVHQSWYQHLSEDRRWIRPDGSLVEHPRELAGRTFDGDPHLWAAGTSSIIPSVFAPGTLDYEGTVGSQIYQLGANQLFVDGFEIARLKGNDFSVWAREAFREHLQSLSRARLDELGIDDPASFDIRTYLEENGVAPGSGTDNPAADPVYREYTRRHHQRHKRYAEQLAEQSKAGAPSAVASAGTTFFGNQAGIAGPFPAPIYLSDAVDEVDIEVDPAPPPARPHDVTVKTGLAAGRFEKPVRIEGKMHRIRAVDTLHGLDPEKQYPVLMQFQVAQGYAHGGIRGLSLSSWGDVPEEDVVNNWVRPDGTIADSLQQFTDFVRSSRRLLDGAEPANNAVLVVSLPTLIWQRAPQWDRHHPTHTDAVRGAAAVLRQEHIPYDVLILDYPAVWAAPEQHEAVQEYDLVVLPGVQSISDKQVASLEAALDGRSTVVATGGAPDRNAEYRPRDDVRTLLEDSESARIVDANPERGAGGGGREALRDALGPVRRQVELGTDGDVSVNVMDAPEGNAVVVHLLNYEYDPEADSMPTRTDLAVTVRDLPFEPVVARHHSPTDVTELDLSTEGRTTSFEVPTLEVWGFVVLGAEATAGAPTTDRSTATRRVDEARQAVGTADEEGRTTRLVAAKAALENAERALDYGAFTQARRIAEDSIEAADEAYRPPVIGIDRGHNQSNEVYESDLATLRETFDSYDYREVEAWDTGTFEAVDVLIVPPIAPESTMEYGFEAAELDAVEAFVQAGGSLLLLGIHRPKSGFDRLADRFGFGLDGRPVTKGTGDFWSFDVDSPLSALTAFNPTWGGKFGTVVDTLEAGTVMGRVTDDHDAWLNSEPPVDERGPEEPSASGEPVLVGRPYGDGHVVISGEAWQFVNPTNPDGAPAPLPRKMLRTLGRRARYARRMDQPTPSPDTTTETRVSQSPAPTEATESQSGPGFGVPVAVGGLAGGAALLKWLLDEEDPP